jgi:hypothetical protein
MVIVWEPLRCLSDRRGVPRAPGIYLVGVKDRSLDDPDGAEIFENEYLGHRYPAGFRAQYVGMSIGKTSGIAGRLRAHAGSRGCRHIAEHIELHGLNSLYFTHIVMDASYLLEVLMLRLRQDGFLEWNTREEINRFARPLWKDLGGAPQRMFLDHLEPWEELPGAGGNQ